MIANLDGKMVVGQFGSFIWGFMQGYDGTVEEGDIFLTTTRTRSTARSATRTTG